MRLIANFGLACAPSSWGNDARLCWQVMNRAAREAQRMSAWIRSPTTASMAPTPAAPTSPPMLHMPWKDAMTRQFMCTSTSAA